MTCLIITPNKQTDVYNYKDRIIDLLLDLNIIDTQLITDNKNLYYAGKKYLNYISFIGCSPVFNVNTCENKTISTLDNTIQNLNYIQFEFELDHLLFKHCDFGVKAICPVCKKRLYEWHALIMSWEKTSKLETQCSNCKQKISLVKINWKKTAGFYHSAILFHGIQPDLALPADQLMTKLNKIAEIDWQYFYC